MPLIFKRFLTGLHCGIVGEASFCDPGIPLGHWFASQLLYFWFSFLLMAVRMTQIHGRLYQWDPTGPMSILSVRKLQSSLVWNVKDKLLTALLLTVLLFAFVWAYIAINLLREKLSNYLLNPTNWKLLCGEWGGGVLNEASHQISNLQNYMRNMRQEEGELIPIFKTCSFSRIKHGQCK